MPRCARLSMECIIIPVRNVVKILHAHNVRHGLSFGQLRRRDVAQTDMANESLLLELDEHGQMFRNRHLRRLLDSSHPEIDDIESLNGEISQVVMNSVY